MGLCWAYACCASCAYLLCLLTYVYYIRMYYYTYVHMELIPQYPQTLPSFNYLSNIIHVDINMVAVCETNTLLLSISVLQTSFAKCCSRNKHLYIRRSPAECGGG